jgi:antitoxin component of RelBE/YafQ-DinJ toxin-antitoxin module
MDQDKTTLLIKLDKDLKESFQQVCKMQDTDISKEIRAFMREYVRKNGQADLFKTTKRK